MLKLSVYKLAPLGLGLIFSTIAFAEEPSNGTLPDGTPFRRDAQGVEVIDYVAELENSVTYLKERVRDLEQQVETGKDAIALLKEQSETANGGEQKAQPKPKLFEADLDISPGANSGTPIGKLEASEKEVTPTVVTAELPQEELKTPEVQVPVITYVTRITTPKIEKEDPPVEVAVKQELPKPVVVKTVVQTVVAKPVPVRPVLTKPLIIPTVVKPAPPKLDPVEIAKGEVFKELAATKKIKIDRDVAFKSYTENPYVNRLKITLAPVQSKERRTLESLDVAVKKAKREREISQIRNEIYQIQRVLRDDIALINRISKLN